MNKLDFFSKPPNLYIFQKRKNKTLFGSILFIIYIIIMLFIFLLYILEYLKNDKYEYNCNTSFIFKKEDEEYDEIFNPTLDFEISLEGGDEFEFQECDFIDGGGVYIKKNGLYKTKRKVNELCIDIKYICNDSNCSSLDSWNASDYSYSLIGPSLTIYYKSFIIDHQGNTPLQIKDEFEDLYMIFPFDPFYLHSGKYTWKNIIYNEKKGISNILLKQKENYHYGFIEDNSRILTTFTLDEPKFDEKLGNYTLDVARAYLDINYNSYIECNRKKNSFLDVIAKIGSLFSTFNFFFCFFYNFYSKNFNNYKLIDKILNIKKESNKFQELERFNLGNSIPLLKEEEKKKDNQQNIKIRDINNKCEPLIKEISNGSNITNNLANINYRIDSDEESNNESKFLKKFSFFDFIYNSVYFKFCKRNKRQEIINSCKKLVSKYLSIDSILINQLKLENLFKDYNWNNVLLNNLENNELIIKIKNLL